MDKKTLLVKTEDVSARHPIGDLPSPLFIVA
jgi:hypothetical protein